MTKQLKIAFGAEEPEKQVETQLSFSDYWETVHSPDQQEVIDEPELDDEPPVTPFNFKLQRRRPLWKDMATFAATSMAIWGLSHVAMNFSAFAEIAEFKVNNLKASITESFEAEAAEPIMLESRKIIQNDKAPKNHVAEVFASWGVHPSDNRLVIPRIEKNVPLVTVPSHKNWKQLETNIQKGLQGGVVVHPISHTPDDSSGNFFLTGHSSYYAWDSGRYKDVFALLHEVQEGDLAEVYWNGKKYVYELTQKKIIPPTETSVLQQPKDRRMITLMTCTPVGTNKNRLIWTGNLIRVE